MNDGAELYVQYMAEQAIIEEELENIVRKERELEERRDESRKLCREERWILEQEESSLREAAEFQQVKGEFEQLVAEQENRFAEEEEALSEEKRETRKRQGRSEEAYQEAVRLLEETGGRACQE